MFATTRSLSISPGIEVDTDVESYAQFEENVARPTGAGRHLLSRQVRPRSPEWRTCIALTSGTASSVPTCSAGAPSKRPVLAGATVKHTASD